MGTHKRVYMQMGPEGGRSGYDHASDHAFGGQGGADRSQPPITEVVPSRPEGTADSLPLSRTPTPRDAAGSFEPRALSPGPSVDDVSPAADQDTDRSDSDVERDAAAQRYAEALAQTTLPDMDGEDDSLFGKARLRGGLVTMPKDENDETSPAYSRFLVAMDPDTKLVVPLAELVGNTCVIDPVTGERKSEWFSKVNRIDENGIDVVVVEPYGEFATMRFEDGETTVIEDGEYDPVPTRDITFAVLVKIASGDFIRTVAKEIGIEGSDELKWGFLPAFRPVPEPEVVYDAEIVTEIPTAEPEAPAPLSHDTIKGAVVGVLKAVMVFDVRAEHAEEKKLSVGGLQELAAYVIENRPDDGLILDHLPDLVENAPDKVSAEDFAIAEAAVAAYFADKNPALLDMLTGYLGRNGQRLIAEPEEMREETVKEPSRARVVYDAALVQLARTKGFTYAMAAITAGLEIGAVPYADMPGIVPLMIAAGATFPGFAVIYEKLARGFDDLNKGVKGGNGEEFTGNEYSDY